MTKKFISMLLALVMVVGMLPMMSLSVSAAGETVISRDDFENFTVGTVFSSAETSSLTDNSGKSSEKDKNTPVVYDAETCYIFNNGYKIASLNNSETLFLSLFEKKANESYFSLEIANDNESNKNYLIAIKKASSNKYNGTNL